RPYSTGFYYSYPGQSYGNSSYTQDADIAAVVESCDEEGNAVLTQRNKFSKGDLLELLIPGERPLPFKADHIYDGEKNEINDTPHAMMELKMKLPAEAPRLSIVRKPKQ
ncbi:MAG: U32 family peptidase C-terminal domain-containing protein, partial [Oscillospiraceae bacterium]|nr:U32 family peptidase C-terminal domain-containing protein [Oscillospiraceae bacterium]